MTREVLRVRTVGVPRIMPIAVNRGYVVRAAAESDEAWKNLKSLRPIPLPRAP